LSRNWRVFGPSPTTGTKYLIIKHLHVVFRAVFLTFSPISHNPDACWCHGVIVHTAPSRSKSVHYVSGVVQLTRIFLRAPSPNRDIFDGGGATVSLPPRREKRSGEQTGPQKVWEATQSVGETALGEFTGRRSDPETDGCVGHGAGQVGDHHGVVALIGRLDGVEGGDTVCLADQFVTVKPPLICERLSLRPARAVKAVRVNAAVRIAELEGTHHKGVGPDGQPVHQIG